MSLNIRRIVTGHDDQGRAKVLIDETVGNAVSQRPGALYSVVWSSEGFPVDNDTELDPSRKKIGTTIPNGTVFRIVSFGPGVAPRNRHGSRRHDRAPQSRRCPGATRDDSQLDQQRLRTLRDCFRTYPGKVGNSRRKTPSGRG